MGKKVSFDFKSVLEEQSMLILKPGFLEAEVERVDINKFVINYFKREKIELLSTMEKTLSRGEVEIIYLSKQGIDESLRKESLNYMSSGPVRAYLVLGSRSQQIANDLKIVLRKFLTKDTSRESIIKNVAHVPDKLEFERTYMVLFPDLQVI